MRIRATRCSCTSATSEPSSPRCRRRPFSPSTGRPSRPEETIVGVGRPSTMSLVLRRLRIENLVLIREAELELAPGLNAITGETGAGKTILAQAIGLLLGSHGDPALVGADGEEAYVEAELDLPDGLLEEEALQALAELRPEDEEGLVLARRVFGDGRTRAYAWGRAAPRDDVAAAAE